MTRVRKQDGRPLGAGQLPDASSTLRSASAKAGHRGPDFSLSLILDLMILDRAPGGHLLGEMAEMPRREPDLHCPARPLTCANDPGEQQPSCHLFSRTILEFTPTATVTPSDDYAAHDADFLPFDQPSPRQVDDNLHGVGRKAH
jgi:hypothetical protein